jgi:hypothetical protein
MVAAAGGDTSKRVLGSCGCGLGGATSVRCLVVVVDGWMDVMDDGQSGRFFSFTKAAATMTESY